MRTFLFIFALTVAVVLTNCKNSQPAEEVKTEETEETKVVDTTANVVKTDSCAVADTTK